MSEKQAGKSETVLLSLSGVHKNTTLHNHDIQTDNLGQTQTSSLATTFIYIRPYQPFLEDSLRHFLVVSFTPLVSTILPSPLPQDFPSSI